MKPKKKFSDFPLGSTTKEWYHGGYEGLLIKYENLVDENIKLKKDKETLIRDIEDLEARLWNAFK